LLSFHSASFSVSSSSSMVLSASLSSCIGVRLAGSSDLLLTK
jgi:hypothetical protein